MTIADHILTYLGEQDMSQREFAERVKITEVTMTRYLRGAIPHAKRLKNIAKELA